MGENTLYHWGIKGMKWGVRRYQNKNGTLTPAGKKRYYDFAAGDQKQKKKKIDIDKAFDQNIKTGKDKAPISAAEKITRESTKIIDNSIQLSNIISRMRKKDDNSNSITTMTNEELQAAINRMRLEDSYRELSTKRIERGKAKVADILSITGGAVGIVSSAVGIVATVKKLKG